MGADCCSFPMFKLVVKEADVKGCFRYTNTVSPCLKTLYFYGPPVLDQLLSMLLCHILQVQAQDFPLLWHVPIIKMPCFARIGFCL